MSDYTCFHIATVTPDWKSDDAKAFPPPIQHHPVAVCFIRLAADGRALVYTDGLNELAGVHERALMQEIIKKLPPDHEQLVGIALRRFTLPVLYYRALHYGIPTQLIEQPPVLGTVCDISEFGDSQKAPALFQLGQLVGFAKRPWMDIAKAWHDGQPQAIVDRLEVDVMLIACVFLRMQYCRGAISAKKYQIQARNVLEVFKDRSTFSTQFLRNSDVPLYLNV